MDLGWLDVCLRVKDFALSQRFYEALGFRMVEGEPANGWGVFVRENARLGLFIADYMQEESFSLNFRGGNVPEVFAHLTSQNLELEKPPVMVGGRSGSIKLRDPDGNLVFIDSAPGEVQPN